MWTQRVYLLFKHLKKCWMYRNSDVWIKASFSDVAIL